jgi:hypothetical protein
LQTGGSSLHFSSQPKTPGGRFCCVKIIALGQKRAHGDSVVFATADRGMFELLPARFEMLIASAVEVFSSSRRFSL